MNIINRLYIRVLPFHYYAVLPDDEGYSQDQEDTDRTVTPVPPKRSKRPNSAALSGELTVVQGTGGAGRASAEVVVVVLLLMFNITTAFDQMHGDA